MRESGWVYIKYIYYYEQLISCTWLTYLNACSSQTPWVMHLYEKYSR